MTLLLYHHPISTCSQKVRLALAEKSLAFEQYVLDTATMEHLEDWYLEINPNGVMPTLVDDGRPILDSSVICEYLDEVWPEPALSPPDPLGRAQMRAWMRYLEEVPTAAIRIPSFNRLFVKFLKNRSEADFEAMTDRMPLRKAFYRQMSETGFSDEATRNSMEQLKNTVRRVQHALADGAPYLLGAQYTIADIVLTPSMVRMEDLGLSELWDEMPAVQAWLDRIKARPSFAAAYVPGSRVDPANYHIGQGSR